MEIQTLSLVVPAGCPNRCRFCVSVLHDDSSYKNQIEKNLRFKALYNMEFRKRLEFARDNGCNTMILTGDGEPLYNMEFLEDVATWNKLLRNPFKWVELQTAGISLETEKLWWLRETVAVNTISLSLSDVFSSDNNALYNRSPEKLKIDIDQLCAQIKEVDFTLRLSLNLTDFYNNYNAEDIFKRVKTLGADQVTFRVLYSSPNANTEEEITVNEWIKNHKANTDILSEINQYIKTNGRALEVLPFGATRYSVDGISTVLDDDCMSTELKNSLKYLILRPNSKLYTKWDDVGSLLF